MLLLLPVPIPLSLLLCACCACGRVADTDADGAGPAPIVEGSTGGCACGLDVFAAVEELLAASAGAAGRALEGSADSTLSASLVDLLDTVAAAATTGCCGVGDLGVDWDTAPVDGVAGGAVGVGTEDVDVTVGTATAGGVTACTTGGVDGRVVCAVVIGTGFVVTSVWGMVMFTVDGLLWSSC